MLLASLQQEWPAMLQALLEHKRMDAYVPDPWVNVFNQTILYEAEEPDILIIHTISNPKEWEICRSTFHPTTEEFCLRSDGTSGSCRGIRTESMHMFEEEPLGFQTSDEDRPGGSAKD